MDQRWLRNFMPAMVGFAEYETGKPLTASFAEKAGSGMSFGRMQSDIAHNGEAEQTLRNILAGAGSTRID